MTSIASQAYENHLSTLFPARNLALESVPWVPLSEGKSFKPIRFLSGNRGFVELLRLEPGIVVPLHRHTGEVHAFNLEGSRQLGTGEIIKPGDYVYEPTGNTDTWKAIGEVPLVIFVVVMGAVEFIGADNSVIRCVTADSLKEIYHQYCTANNIQLLDLVD